jgi:hypothetical protein
MEKWVKMNETKNYAKPADEATCAATEKSITTG